MIYGFIAARIAKKTENGAPGFPVKTKKSGTFATWTVDCWGDFVHSEGQEDLK